jgi:hypothetical protein
MNDRKRLPPGIFLPALLAMAAVAVLALQIRNERNAPPAVMPVAAATRPATESQARESSPAVAKGLFAVVKPNGSRVVFTWNDLKKMPLARMTAAGRVEEGVKLLEVLAAAGIATFTEVKLTGSSNPTSLTFAQVKDESTILDFTGRGTVKLATLHLPKSGWTKDVTRIEVVECIGGADVCP